MKLVKITTDNYPDMFNEGLDNYVFVNESKDIIGKASINDSLEINKLKVSIDDKYRSNGYGKDIFRQLLEEYKTNYRATDELRFQINNENRFNSILYQFGGINISNNNGDLVYVLPVR